MLPIYLVNLDRRPDKLAFMEGQLQSMGLSFERVSAIDGRDHPEGPPDPHVARSNHIIPMTLGSQCYAASLRKALSVFLATSAEAALFLQDDGELSADLPAFLDDIDWIPSGIGIVQFEKWRERRGEKLLAPPIGDMPVTGRHLHPLCSRTGGAACFIVTRRAAEAILAIPLIRYPADHLLFSPNVSPIFDAVGVAMVQPSLCIQRPEDVSSDLNEWRKRDRSFATRRRRAWTEINRAPRQVVDMLFRGARWIDTTYADRTGPDANDNT